MEEANEETVECWLDHYWVTGVTFTNRSLAASNLSPDMQIERQRMLAHDEDDVLVVRPEALARATASSLTSVLGEPVSVVAELRFFPYGVLQQRTIVRARIHVMPRLESAAVKAVVDAYPEMSTTATIVANTLGVDLLKQPAILGRMRGSLDCPQSDAHDLCLYWPNVFLENANQRDAVHAALGKDASNTVDLPTWGGIELKAAWGFLSWCGDWSDPSVRKSRDEAMLAIAVACSEEIITHVSGMQYSSLLAHAAEDKLRGSAAHDVRLLFSKNALLLSYVLARRTCIKTTQRNLYEKARETTGRIQEKEERRVVLRAELTEAIEANRAREHRWANMTLNVILGAISILGFSSWAFDAFNFVGGEPFPLTACHVRLSAASLIAGACFLLLIPWAWALKRMHA